MAQLARGLQITVNMLYLALVCNKTISYNYMFGNREHLNKQRSWVHGDLLDVPAEQISIPEIIEIKFVIDFVNVDSDKRIQIYRDYSDVDIQIIPIAQGRCEVVIKYSSNHPLNQMN